MNNDPEFAHQIEDPSQSAALFAFLRGILGASSIETLLEQLAAFSVNADCAMIAMRRCVISADGLPQLDPEAFWLRPDTLIEPWPESIQIDGDSLVKLWIMSGGPPTFVDDIRAYAFFTDASRAFHEQQGIISLYHILLRWQEEPLAVLSVYWQRTQAFSADFRAIVELTAWVLSPVAASLYLQHEKRQLMQTIREMEQRLGEAETTLHSLAHDLKQPLTNIVTSASILNTYLDRFSKDQIIEKLQRITSAGLHMNDWITSLLLLAQVRDMKDVQFEPIAPQQPVNAAVSTMHSILQERGATLIYDTRFADLPPVLGNAVWIEHIWTNLISNAYKYGGTPPEITLSAETLPDGLRFSVHDNGPGIPADKLNVIFEPFTRLRTHGKSQSGTGVGLTTAKLLAEKLNGSIGVTSDSQGSTFWFTLPRSDAPAR